MQTELIQFIRHGWINSCPPSSIYASMSYCNSNCEFYLLECAFIIFSDLNCKASSYATAWWWLQSRQKVRNRRSCLVSNVEGACSPFAVKMLGVWNSLSVHQHKDTTPVCIRNIYSWEGPWRGTYSVVFLCLASRSLVVRQEILVVLLSLWICTCSSPCSYGR